MLGKNYFKKLCAISLQGGNPDQARVLAGTYLCFVREHSVGQLISQGLAHLSITTLPFGLCCPFSVLRLRQNSCWKWNTSDLQGSSTWQLPFRWENSLQRATTPCLFSRFDQVLPWNRCMVGNQAVPPLAQVLFRRGMRYLICLLISRSHSKFGPILPAQPLCKHLKESTDLLW